LTDLKEAHKIQDMAAIDKAAETMNNAWQAASQDIYQAQQNAGGQEGGAQDFGAGNNSNGAGTTEDVTDVEFEEVGDKK
jgi:molecular chaperone DnaK